MGLLYTLIGFGFVAIASQQIARMLTRLRDEVILVGTSEDIEGVSLRLGY
jgi:hypothetical protein